VRPIEELRYERRKQFVTTNPLPEHFPCVSFHSSTSDATSLLFAPAAYFRRRYHRQRYDMGCVRGFRGVIWGV
jgi:hypothetical protein